jgi:tetratricopeptide (TPR) repeat protein
MMRARQILDSGAWDQLERWSYDLSDAPAVAPSYDFLDAYVALERGDDRPAREAVARWEREVDGGDMLRTWWITPDRVRIQIHELKGLLALDEGRPADAVTLLRRAAALEETLPMEFGPPASLKPPHELLGEVLLELHRYDEAVEAFRGSLELAPRRTPSLRGLAAAARGAGDTALAADTEGTIREIVHASRGETGMGR